MKISVIGTGGWGTALSLVLCEKGHQVTLWSRSREKAEEIACSRVNSHLPGVSLPEGIVLTSGTERLSGSEMVVFATPSFALRQTARQLAPALRPDAVLVSVVKGIEPGTNLRMTEILQQECPGHPVAALSGPSHAEEVGRHLPTGCVAATPDLALAELVQDVFMTPVFRIYSNPDIVGVELGGALKNVLAISCGISDGLGYGDNARALLMTRGITEMARLGTRLGGQAETFAGLSGVGDLFVTCTSMHSRNRRCGILMGQGKSFAQAAQEIGAVVEGYYAAVSAVELARKVQADLPAFQCVYEVLYQGRDPRNAADTLMNRKKRTELDEDSSREGAR